MTTTLLPLSLHYWTKPLAQANDAWRSSSKGFSGATTSKDSVFVAAITPTMSSLARYHSAASSEASAALLAVPRTQQRSFPKQAYRVFPRRRFGIAIPQIPLRRCICKPKPELDRLGTHLVCMCPKGRERFITHDSMAICIRGIAKAAGAYAKFENPDRFRAIDTDNGTRPDLIFVGIQEHRIFGNFLITAPCCSTLTRQKANIQGWAAKRGEVSKVGKYGGPASQGGQVSLSFVFIGKHSSKTYLMVCQSPNCDDLRVMKRKEERYVVKHRYRRAKR